MPVVRWDRADALGMVDPGAIDGLDGAVLVLDGVVRADDDRLAWCRWAPCVVVALVPAGEVAPGATDLALVGDEVALLDELVRCIEAQPRASRVLVDVLRATATIDVAAALTVESLAYSMLLGGADFAAWLQARSVPERRTDEGAPVHVDRDGAVLEVTLARPESRNALSAAMRDALVEALHVAEVDTTIERVVLRGAGPDFCSGGHLGEFGTARDIVVAHEIRARRSVGAVLARLAPRVTAHVHGSSVGAGVELAAFAGTVVADDGATFRLPEVGMGLIPGAGGTVSITRRIGRQATALLTILGTPVDAHRAHALGLVDEVAPN